MLRDHFQLSAKNYSEVKKILKWFYSQNHFKQNGKTDTSRDDIFRMSYLKRCMMYLDKCDRKLTMVCVMNLNVLMM